MRSIASGTQARAERRGRRFFLCCVRPNKIRPEKFVCRDRKFVRRIFRRSRPDILLLRRRAHRDGGFRALIWKNRGRRKKFSAVFRELLRETPPAVSSTVRRPAVARFHRRRKFRKRRRRPAKLRGVRRINFRTFCDRATRGIPRRRRRNLGLRAQLRLWNGVRPRIAPRRQDQDPRLDQEFSARHFRRIFFRNPRDEDRVRRARDPEARSPRSRVARRPAREVENFRQGRARRDLGAARIRGRGRAVRVSVRRPCRRRRHERQISESARPASADVARDRNFMFDRPRVRGSGIRDRGRRAICDRKCREVRRTLRDFAKFAKFAKFPPPDRGPFRHQNFSR